MTFQNMGISIQMYAAVCTKKMFATCLNLHLWQSCSCQKSFSHKKQQPNAAFTFRDIKTTKDARSTIACCTQSLQFETNIYIRKKILFQSLLYKHILVCMYTYVEVHEVAHCLELHLRFCYLCKYDFEKSQQFCIQEVVKAFNSKLIYIFYKFLVYISDKFDS